MNTHCSWRLVLPDLLQSMEEQPSTRKVVCHYYCLSCRREGGTAVMECSSGAAAGLDGLHRLIYLRALRFGTSLTTTHCSSGIDFALVEGDTSVLSSRSWLSGLMIVRCDLSPSLAAGCCCLSLLPCAACRYQDQSGWQACPYCHFHFYQRQHS